MRQPSLCSLTAPPTTRAILIPKGRIIAGLVSSTCVLAASGSPTSSSSARTTTHSTSTATEPTAHYSDVEGDTATVTLSSQPVVQPGQVPNDIAQTCLGTVPGTDRLMLNETLFREVDGSLTLTSGRPTQARIRFGGSSFANSPSGQTVVLVTSNGPVCSGSTALTWSMVLPSRAVHFAIWLVHPNVLTPSEPTDDQSVINAAAWSTRWSSSLTQKRRSGPSPARG